MLDVVAWLGELPPVVVYVVAAALVFAETGLIIGLVLPGEITLLFVGFLCSVGTLDPLVAAAILIVAALAGDGLGFTMGRRSGRRLEVSRLGRWVGERRWARTDALLDRYGGGAIFIGRYVAFARTLMPRLCAIAGMPYQRFLRWDLLGVITQVIASIALGYAVGSSYQAAAEYLGRATGAFVLLLAVLFASSPVWAVSG